VDFGALYRHYTADLNRTGVIGEVSPEMRDHYQVYVEANEKGTRAVRPGATTADVYKEIANTFIEAGLTFPWVRAGHGIGLDPHEPPHLSPFDTTIIKPGMIFAVEPFGVPNKNGTILNCEDNVLCTDSGSERLSIPAREIFAA